MTESGSSIQEETMIDNQNEIKETKLSWLVWSLGCLFYFYEFLLQVSPGIMQTELSHDFNISAQGVGVLVGAYFYSYAGMQIPAGILLDKLGPHKLLTFATLICAVSTLAFAHTSSFEMALIARFSIGFGSAFAAVGTMKLAANWFPSQRFALLTGLMVAIGMSGAIGGEKPLAMFIHLFGWRTSFDILGAVGILLALALFFIGRDAPIETDPPAQSISILEALCDTLKDLRKVISAPQVWLVSIYGGLVFMATPVFCGLWGVPFLEAKYHLELDMAATLSSLIFVGWIIGSPAWGLISDKIALRKPPMFIGALVAFICLSAVIYFPLKSNFLIGTLLFTFGLFSAGFLPAFSIIKEISCQKNCATALSFMNMMNMIGIAIAQPLIGSLLDKFWLQDNGQQAESMLRTYSGSHYTLAMSILPLGMFLALLLLPFIKETHCQFSKE